MQIQDDVSLFSVHMTSIGKTETKPCHRKIYCSRANARRFIIHLWKCSKINTLLLRPPAIQPVMSSRDHSRVG